MTGTRIACVGGGLIGSAWAAQFAAKGFSVRVQDPNPDAETVLSEVVAEAAEALGVSRDSIAQRITFITDLAEAVGDADFIQESAPESLELKQRLFAEIDRMAPESAVIASSTSDFPMSLIQKDCCRPERTLVGHPINPPYAVPLVEVVPSPTTNRATIDRAVALYRVAGKQPLLLDREVTGFVANRLQMAVAREALQLVTRGEASVTAVDHALMHGVGPRFAAVGLFGGYILNIPGHDVERWLDHLAEFKFGEELVHSEPMPEWTPELRSVVASQWRERLRTVGTDALRRARDSMSLAIARLRHTNQGQ